MNSLEKITLAKRIEIFDMIALEEKFLLLMIKDINEEKEIKIVDAGFPKFFKKK